MSTANNIANQLTDSLKTEIKGSALLIGLCREKKRNAINDEMILGLEKILTNIPLTVKCVIIYGEGNHFSAGVDLSEIKQQSDPLDGLLHSRMWHRVLDCVQFGTVPVIAVLHGAVVGGGLELASAAHIRVAEPTAFYALPEGQRGIFVGGGASVRIPKLIGAARMTDMMLTGRVYNAEEGLSIGLSQYLVEEGKGLDKAFELAEKIASNASMINYALMHILPRIADASQEQALMMESLIAALTKNTPDAQSRLQHFLDGKAKKVGE